MRVTSSRLVKPRVLCEKGQTNDDCVYFIYLFVWLDVGLHVNAFIYLFVHILACSFVIREVDPKILIFTVLSQEC